MQIFDAKSDTCTVGHGALIESRCCPTLANNPCIICPDGASAGEEIVPYSGVNRTCKDFIEAALIFDAESEMCLVHGKLDEYTCCPSCATAFDDYVTSAQVTMGEDFVPWSLSLTCNGEVEYTKIYENASVGCNHSMGYEL